VSRDVEHPLTYDLTFQDVIAILRLVDAGSPAELDLELEGLKLRVVSRGGRRATEDGPPPQRPSPALRPVAAESETRQESPPGAPAAAGQASTPAVAAQEEAVGRERPVRREQAGGVPVRSPLTGVFYRAPAPGAPPYVQVGGAIREGDTIGLIEVMKLFTPVAAPRSGIVREICVQDQELVQSQQVLAIIEPAAR
jgi:acetyl-CoA carboxylase biotin carboxyl carrier protein